MKMSENVDKQKAMDLAEDSRESEWKYPSFVAELFRGNFRWDLVYPFLEQDPEDKRIGDELIERVRGVLEAHLDPDDVDRTCQIPDEAIAALAEIGCFGLKIPKEYGGLGLSQINYNRVIGFVGSYCNSTAVWLSAHQSIGLPQPLKLFGTKEQKEKYLPRLAAGAVSAFALTEVNVGSDPARMKTVATPSDDGEFYIINGEKLWCTNGPAAELLLVMAVTPPKIVKGKEKTQITAFIVEKDMPGFEVAHLCNFMGIRGIRNGLLRFTNVRVPKENIVGKPGEGLRIALTTLNTGRLTIPATAAAAAKAALHFSHDWGNSRVQWGLPIFKHQAVAKMAGNIAADTFAMDSMNLLACGMVDRGKVDIRLEAAMTKYYATEAAWKLLDDFLQIRGGRGYETTLSLASRGEKPVPTERMLRDARISRIIEGSTEIMRLVIAREAMDMHMQIGGPLVMDKSKTLMQKLPLFLKAAKFYAGWYPKQWMPAATAQARYLNVANQRHLHFLPGTARRLARTVFHAMAKYGPKLEFEQLILQNFVDIGTDIFAMAAVLSRADSLLAKGESQALQDVVDLFCQNARERIALSFKTVKHNHNKVYNKVAGHVLEDKYRWLITDTYTDFPPSVRPAEVASEGAAHGLTRTAAD